MRCNKLCKRGMLWVASMVILMVLTSCQQKDNNVYPDLSSSKEEEVVELSITYSGSDVNWVATIEKMGERFMKDNPGIILKMEPSDSGRYTEFLKTKAAVGEFPDIFEIQEPVQFVKAGKIGVIPNSVRALVDDPIMVDKKAFAVPLYSTTYGIIYNKDLFEKYNLTPPKKYSDFLNICETLKKKDVLPIAMGEKDEGHMSYLLNYFYQSEVVKENPNWQVDRALGKVSFRDKEPENMLKKYKQIFDLGYAEADYMNMSESQVITQLIDNKAAMLYAGPWIFSQILDMDPDYPLGWFFLPDESGETTAISACESEWAISTECEKDYKKLKAATLFFEYYYSITNYRGVLQSMNALPTTKMAVLYPSVVAQQDLLVDYRYAKKSNNYLGNYQTPEEFNSYLSKVLQSVVANIYTIDEALLKLDEKWNNIEGLK